MVKWNSLERAYLGKKVRQVMDNNEINRIIKDATEYVRNPLHVEKFGEIALGLYDLHRELNPVYKKYDKGPLTDWREIPLMPIGEFKRGDVGLIMSDRMPFPGVEFHSSGTTQGDKSKHRMYDTEAYRAAIACGFRDQVSNIPIPSYRLVLLTPRLPNSSLYYMMSYLSELHDFRGVREEFDGMINASRVQELLTSLTDETEPVIIFGTSLAFYDLIKTISSNGLPPVTLPKGSMMIETGGWKGRDITITPQQLTSMVKDQFGLPVEDLVREYSMSEISSQLYAWGNTNPPLYSAPEHLKVRLVDPLSQTEVEWGQSGIISFVDIANVWSCPFILTEDLGHLVDMDGFEKLVLEGRAVNAPEKGCSLTYAQAMDN